MTQKYNIGGLCGIIQWSFMNKVNGVECDSGTVLLSQKSSCVFICHMIILSLTVFLAKKSREPYK